MKKRTILSFLALLCLVGSGVALNGPKTASGDPPINPGGNADEGFHVDLWGGDPTDTLRLNPGDRVPEILIENILNHPTGEAHISDFEGKLLILDFWASWCSPRLAAFPKIIDFKEKFGDRLEILPVTYETEEKVTGVLKRLKQGRGLEIDFPMAVSNHVLINFFPHSSLPHYVWIDPSGEVIGITGADEFTEEKIVEALGGGLNAKVKQDFRIPFFESESIISGHRHVAHKAVKFQSALTGFIPGWNGGYRPFQEMEDGTFKAVVKNSSLKALYRHAYSYDNLKHAIVKSRIEIEVEDPTPIEFPGGSTEAYAKWLESYGFCYELIVDGEHWLRRFELFQDDLKRYFPQYSVSFEERPKTVLILQRLADTTLNLPVSSEPPSIHRAPLSFQMTNGFLDSFIEYLAFYPLQLDKRPVVNEAGVDWKVDLNIETDLSDLEEVNKKLQPYGLEIAEGEREVTLMVIKDNPTNRDNTNPKQINK